MSANPTVYYQLVAGGVVNGGFVSVALAQAAAASIYPPGTPYVIVPSLASGTVPFAAGAGAPSS